VVRGNRLRAGWLLAAGWLAVVSALLFGFWTRLSGGAGVWLRVHGGACGGERRDLSFLLTASVRCWLPVL
jgi:uncharacterized membrane protein YedE/YeeE